MRAEVDSESVSCAVETHWDAVVVDKLASEEDCPFEYVRVLVDVPDWRIELTTDTTVERPRPFAVLDIETLGFAVVGEEVMLIVDCDELVTEDEPRGSMPAPSAFA